MKKHLLMLLLASNFTAYAQHASSEKYIVTADDDTTWCSEIKLKSMSITCQTSGDKIEIRNETVRRIYMPVEKSDWASFFDNYANSNKKDGYLYSPAQVKKTLEAKIYPRFFDLKPLDPDNDFWTRGLFEILVENKGYKLCKLKEVKSRTPSFASAPDENLDKYILFEENEAKGITLDKNNYKSLLNKIFKGCTEVETALRNNDLNPLKDMAKLLAKFGTCK